MDILKELPDNSIDLVLTDPPYAIGEDGYRPDRTRGGVQFTTYDKIKWDREKPSADCFSEIFRVSKNQIIFGANYFVEYLTSSMGWIFWDKMMGGDFSDGELIYTSFQRALKKITMCSFHNRATTKESADKQKRIHPTQKPVKLFEKILYDYGKENDLILDPFSGSGTTAIAAHRLNRRFICIEKEKKYYDLSCRRLKEEQAQGELF